NVYAAKINYSQKLALGICPKCGGKLVQRNGRYGSFYGCSNYPRCKFTTK
ncbi:MAG: topoisomerase DNA-binding C4 zinc finger domain-containing protein, partial [Muribaculaceae bacterium]|nr:topoisomerase DNA-binding C4 zinc finger domain-containing protein [Muribaculaceae bacterium]